MVVAILSLAAIFGGVRIDPSASVEFRLEILAASLMTLAASLFIWIARLAKHLSSPPKRSMAAP